MKFLLKNNPVKKPKISFLLIDWNVRESFHVLNYLNRQNINRDEYEVIWVEFYSHRAPEIDEMIERHQKLDIPSPIDTWLLMENPADVCYHKHKMYNEGLLCAESDVFVIMDSDSALQTDFVEYLIHEFDKEKHQVLHLEQVRNFDHKYYPFNYPSHSEIIGEGCVNAKKGIPNGFGRKPLSLKKNWNLWHIYNYGSCFVANREDILKIGGSDEHIDYMGHICGPYELTARLINAGHPDQLSNKHWTYHMWHPNTGGSNNYCGPHNGKGMSTTAMEIPKSGRILPLVENPKIQERRLCTTLETHALHTR